MEEKEFAHAASDLTDHEISNCFKIIELLRFKYSGRRNTVKNLESLRDETLTRLAEISILATMDVSPCLYGQPPEIEILGKLDVDPIHKYGFDHELKKQEVNKANDRGEDWLGQKGTSDAAKAKKRDKNGK